jgi:UDP-N-acetylmuramyl pentapeptide phosphotransferase/UDP-N-acetylglucosamine-1-phosphate transferase
MFYLVITLLFFLTELLYFHLAKRYGILDIPNHRSAHQKATIRGIGILFPIAVLTFFVISGFQYPYFILGLILISTVSFVDDIRPLPNRYRIIVQFMSVGLLLFELFRYHDFVGFLALAVVFIVSVGIINAYNFMDGINGITGTYSLLVMATLYYVNNNVIEFIDKQLLVIIGLSICVFLFFNFRKKAVGFCGDVGSVSIAFVVIFCIGMLILKSSDWKYIFLLSAYGIDTIYTLVYRLLKRENIFKAHKLHFFQLLVHEYNWSHLQVSLLFAVIQLLINILVVSYNLNSLVFYIPMIVILLLVHVYRFKKGVAIGQKEVR